MMTGFKIPMYSELKLFLYSALILLGCFHCCRGHATAAGLTFELPDNEKFCFQQDFEGSEMYMLDYRVIAGGNYDVDVSLESPSGKFVYKETKQEMDSITFETSWGTYKLCFSNEFSTITHKKVYFNLRPEEHDLLAAEGGKMAPGVNTLMEAAMEKIHSMCSTVMHYQTQYRLNESKGRIAADALNTHVQWWSMSQGLIVLFTGVGQVFVLRRFFTDTRQSALSSLINTHKVSVPPAARV